MTSLQFGWIDFSKEQRNKVLSVINLLSEPGAVDELGIGIVRDAFANLFFLALQRSKQGLSIFLSFLTFLQNLKGKKVLILRRC